MRRFLITLVLISAFVTTLPASFAQQQQRRTSKKTTAAVSLSSQRGTDLITAKQLSDYLYFIASDEMEGRDTPSRGLDTTAKFIAMNLSRWGFKPAGDNGTYFQRIALRRERIDETQTRGEINGQSIAFGEDFIPLAAGEVPSAPLVYVGNGWLIKSKNINAYQGVDVRDKVMVVFGSGFPRGLVRADLTGRRGEDWSDPATYAQRNGARGIIVIPDFSTLADWDRQRQRILERGTVTVEKFRKPNAPARVPSIVLSPRMVNLLFRGEKQTAETIFNSGVNGLSNDSIAAFDLNPDKRVRFTIAAKPETIYTQNVVAIFEGRDPVLKNEYVALGAHYDHIGITAPVNNDAINNGADDDGSGTTAVLAMAEALSHASVRPKRSILFVWHCGEEKGLWGSQYFTENPTVPLNQIITQINIDMIGRSKPEGDTNPLDKELSGPNEIYVIGSKMMSTQLGALSERVNSSYLNLNFNYRYDDPADLNRFFFRSDHFNYAQHGIPIIFYFDGVHQDYHRPSDSPDKIDYQKMERVARTIYMTLWEVADMSARPVIDKQLPSELRQQ